MRLSDDERRLLERRAEISGVSVSEFIRGLIVKKDDDESMARLKRVIATWADISTPEENMRGALLAQLADTAANLASFRGYLSLKELDMIATIALKVRGLPGAYVKVSEESKSLNAHVHTTAPATWEERIEEAHSGGHGAGDHRALAGRGDADVIDLPVVVAGHAVVGAADPEDAPASSNGHGRGSRRSRAGGLVSDAPRDGAAQ